MKKLSIGILLGLTSAGLYFFTPIGDYLSREGMASLTAWIQSQGNWAPLIFGLIYITATVLALPGSVLTIGGGLIFGALWGTVINLVSATTGALLAFLMARYLGRDMVDRLLPNQSTLGGLDAKIGRNGFQSVLILRLVPLIPFNVLNFGLGLTRVRLADYLFATILGMMPGTFVFTSLGSVGRHLDFSDPATWADYHVWGPFVLVLLLSLIPRLIKRERAQTTNPEQGQPN